MLTTLTAILLALAVSFGGAGATVYAAQAALPGDVLYPVKIGLEDAQMALSSNEGTHAQLRVEFAERRMEETIALIAQGRYEDVHAAADRLESNAHQATEAFGAVAQVDPDYARTLVESLDTGLARHAQVLSNLLVTLPDLPDEARPGILRALQVCEASRERLRIRQQWRTEQPDDDVPLGPPDHAPQEPPDDAAQGPPDDAPQGPPVDAPQGPPDDAPQGPPGDAPQGPPDDAPQGPPDDAPQGSPHDAPQGPTDDAPQGSPDDAPQGSPDDAPQGPPADAPQDPPDDAPQGPPADAPQDPPDDAPQGPPDEAHRGSSVRNR